MQNQSPSCAPFSKALCLKEYALKYDNLISKIEHAYSLMLALNILEKVTEIKKIDHHPDYDLTPYQGPCTSNYVFKDTVSIPKSLSSLINVNLGIAKIIHFDDLKNLASSCSLPFSSGLGGEYIIECALENNEDAFSHSGFEPEIDQFKLNEIKAVINNDGSKTVDLEGSFIGDSYGISPEDWDLYTEIIYIGFKSSLDDEDFYVELISQSYSMHAQKHYKLAFFLAYSALENYTNCKLNSNEVEDRLTDKINRLFKKFFPESDLSKHNVYTTVIGQFKKRLTPLRNHIAHGRRHVFKNEESLEMLIYTLVLIASIETKESNLKKLIEV